jgi:hypothetical protein
VATKYRIDAIKKAESGSDGIEARIRLNMVDEEVMGI